MANYEGASRTNYFKVKDEEVFRSWAKKYRLGVIEQGGLFGLLPGDTEDGCFNLKDEGEDDPLDLGAELVDHLADGSIAVVISAGHEKLRYVDGWAVAVDNKGESVTITLNDIYDLAAAKFGIKPTRAVS